MAFPEFLLPSISVARSRVHCSEYQKQSRKEGGIYQFKRCDSLLLCKLIVSPGGSAALHEGMGESSLFRRVCPHAEAPCALTELSVSLSGTCFQTSPKGHTRHAGLGVMPWYKPRSALGHTEKSHQKPQPFPALLHKGKLAVGWVLSFQLYMDSMGWVSTGRYHLPGTWVQWVQITSALTKSVLKT